MTLAVKKRNDDERDVPLRPTHIILTAPSVYAHTMLMQME